MDRLALPLTESDLHSDLGTDFGAPSHGDALVPLQVRLRRMIDDTSSQTSTPTRTYRSLLGRHHGRDDVTFSVHSTTADDDAAAVGAWRCGPQALASARAQTVAFDGVFASSACPSARDACSDAGSAFDAASEASESRGLLPSALVTRLRRLCTRTLDDSSGGAGGSAAAVEQVQCDVRVTCHVKPRRGSPALRFSASGDKSPDASDDDSVGSASHVADLLDLNAFFQLPELPAAGRQLDTASSFDAVSIPSRALDSGCAGDADMPEPAMVHASIADMVRAARPAGRPRLGRRFRRPPAAAAKAVELESFVPLDAEQAAAIWSWLEQ